MQSAGVTGDCEAHLPYSKCLEDREERVANVELMAAQEAPSLSMAFRMTISLRIHATRANFFGLPADQQLLVEVPDQGVPAYPGKCPHVVDTPGYAPLST